ncbi:MAG: UDP-4-amino-4,6-dideoxy-N-acetyl-beta-L-altrosamine transaminase [Candidatus Aenigmarchaeota archaeon]|nr:UDP-4-amino-4,6-dideoxy-N-acetyl-beta-L-altrosamine transaminase [Candidatus Aenigmarchaeota archaeon]
MENKFLPFSQPLIEKDEIDEVIDTLKSGWLTMGKKTIEFEKLISEYIGCKYAIVVNSCTAALHLSLLALNIGPGDEVITSPYTFASTGNMIIQTGAKPIFVDIKKDTYNIDPEKIREAITPKTKAIIPMHFAGQACDMKEIQKIAKEYDLHIIEDAAHAIGAEYNNKKIGSESELCCFSFYPIKNITTGEGGAIVTNNDKFVDRLKKLRLHGISKDAWKRYDMGNWYYEIEECGWKYNITDIQSAIGIHQIKKLNNFIRIRNSYAKMYNDAFSDLDVTIPFKKKNVKHAYHLYALLVNNRDKFIEKMKKKNIYCTVNFIPLHLHPLYKKLGYKEGDFPIAEFIYKKEVSLPLYPKMTKDDITRVIQAVREIVNE